MKKFLVGLLFLFFSTLAHAQNALVVQSCGTLRQQYSAGATRQVTVDVNGNLCLGGSGGGFSNYALENGGNLASILSAVQTAIPPGTNVIGSVGFDSGSAPVQTATPNGSSHAAGSSVGGLFSIPVARVNGGGGIITSLSWISTGGATTQLLVRLWDKNPTGTTCTDQTAFVESATDDQHLLAAPFTMTPAAPAVTTGDTNTYAATTGLTLSYKNQDSSATKNVYACVLTVATDTADESKAVYINLTGPQD